MSPHPVSPEAPVLDGRARTNGHVEPEPSPAPPRDPVIPLIDPDEPAAVAVRVALAHGAQRLRAAEPSARARQPEGVHRMRTSARRLRSVLRAFEDLLEGEWSEGLENELKWLGRVLGDVRDLDVLVEDLRARAGDGAGALGPLFESLHARAAAARHVLEESLDGARFQELLARLEAAAACPCLREEAWGPCRDVLPDLVASTWKRLKKPGRGLDLDDPDEAFHEVRKKAKAVRYAAEAVANALGPRAGRDAARLARKARKVQDVLGAHQDAVVAADEVERVRGTFPDDAPLQEAACALLDDLRDDAEASRDRFFKVWPKLDRKALRRWLK